MTPIGNHSISISIEPSGPHELVMAAVWQNDALWDGVDQDEVLSTMA